MTDLATSEVAFARPTSRDEVWRFTPLNRLEPLLDDRPADGSVEVTADGGVAVEVIEAADPRVGSGYTPFDRAGAIALARTEKVWLVSVPAGAELTGTVRLAVGPGTSYGHLLIEVGAQAQATIVLEHTGEGAFAGGVEILLGDAADLTVVSVQDFAPTALHTAAHVARLGRDARYRHLAVTLGGDVVRLTPRVVYTAPGGDAELLGLYFADAGQHLEHRLVVDHSEPNCKSRVTYKGALQGKRAHAVWVGDVIIRTAAVGTDTYELNRNLLLTDGARADSVPNLEIETGEVAGAGHASATGRFDDEQLFYLQARGIPEDAARRLVVRGFFAELLDRVRLPELRARLDAAIDAELAQVGV